MPTKPINEPIDDREMQRVTWAMERIGDAVRPLSQRCKLWALNAALRDALDSYEAK